MNAMTQLHRGGTFCLVGLMLTLVGCAGWKMPEAPVADVSPQRQQRQAEAQQTIETSRDLAELKAALASWNQGDSAGCEKTLRQLLARNPENREARLLFAEACMANDRPEEAFQEIEFALRTWPDDAQVQFTAAVLLETAGQTNSALAHYRRAVDLEPGNETYAVCYETTLLDARTVGPEALPFDGSIDSADVGFVTIGDAIDAASPDYTGDVEPAGYAEISE